MSFAYLLAAATLILIGCNYALTLFGTMRDKNIYEAGLARSILANRKLGMLWFAIMLNMLSVACGFIISIIEVAPLFVYAVLCFSVIWTFLDFCNDYDVVVNKEDGLKLFQRFYDAH
jgi:hypothetical protein